jgi:hypothetical protein
MLTIEAAFQQELGAVSIPPALDGVPTDKQRKCEKIRSVANGM